MTLIVKPKNLKCLMSNIFRSIGYPIGHQIILRTKLIPMELRCMIHRINYPYPKPNQTSYFGTVLVQIWIFGSGFYSHAYFLSMMFSSFSLFGCNSCHVLTLWHFNEVSLTVVSFDIGCERLSAPIFSSSERSAKHQQCSPNVGLVKIS